MAAHVAGGKKTRGAEINRAKTPLRPRCCGRRGALPLRDALHAKLAAEVDRRHAARSWQGQGGIHPVIRTWQRVEEIFGSIRFRRRRLARRLGADWFNFTALNNPPNHPARFDAGHVLRRHETAPTACRCCTLPHLADADLRYARMHAGDVTSRGKPIKVIAPGRTYRVDSDKPPTRRCSIRSRDSGLTNISFADLNGVYTDFLRRFSESDDLRSALPAELLPCHRGRPPRSTLEVRAGR